MEQTGTTIVEYSQTEAALAELRARIGGAQYDVLTTEGMDHAKRDRRELVTLRTSLEKKRVEIKAPALAHCQRIDSEAKRITAEIVKIEQPIDEIIKAEEKRKADIKAEAERKEQERIDTIMERINRIKGAPEKAMLMTSTGLLEAIAVFKELVIGPEYAEFQERVIKIKDGTIVELERILAEKVEAERIAEEQRLEQERIEAEAQEKRRLEDEEREHQRIANEAEAQRLRIEREKIDQENKQRELEFLERERIQREKDEEIRKEQERIKNENLALERQKFEAAERERIAMEEEERKAAAPVAEVCEDIILRNCGAVGWLGIYGEYRTGKHFTTATLALNQVLKYINETATKEVV